MATGPIGFSLPERTEPDSNAFDTRPHKVEQWLTALPLANVGETTRLVFNTLHGVNRLQLPWQARHALLELLRPTIFHIESALQQHFTGLTIPLPERACQVVSLTQSLHKEMTLGYKIAVENMLGGDTVKQDQKALCQMLHRIVCHHSHTLLIAYQTYSHYPPGTWLDLHTIYLRAHDEGMHEQIVADECPSHHTASSIEQLYKQILLLALASPYRLRQGEARSLFQALRDWSQYAHILDVHDPSAGKALFIVHMDSDHEPEYAAYDIRHCENQLCHYIDTSLLTQKLEEEGTQAEELSSGGTTSASTLSPDLLRRLGLAWGLVSKRGSQRQEKHEKIAAIIGLSALHEMLLSNHCEASIPASSPLEPPNKDVPTANEACLDMWSLFSPNKLHESIEVHDEQPLTQGYEVVIHEWAIQNQSNGGYRLEVHEDWVKLRIGDLIGLRHSEMHPWEIGVIRWLNQQDGTHLSLGVQLLAPMAYPVMLHNQHPGDDYQRALLLPGIKALKQAPSLLTPSSLFSANADIRLLTAGKELPISLNEQHQDTGSFSQFLFEGAAHNEEYTEVPFGEHSTLVPGTWPQL